jgi:hypothetical protein
LNQDHAVTGRHYHWQQALYALKSLDRVILYWLINTPVKIPILCCFFTWKSQRILQLVPENIDCCRCQQTSRRKIDVAPIFKVFLTSSTLQWAGRL